METITFTIDRLDADVADALRARPGCFAARVTR
jgi:hypothetical protein